MSPSTFPRNRVPVKVHDRHDDGCVVLHEEEHPERESAEQRTPDVRHHRRKLQRSTFDAMENPADPRQEGQAQAFSFALVPGSRFESIGLRFGADAQSSGLQATFNPVQDLPPGSRLLRRFPMNREALLELFDVKRLGFA